MEAHERHTVVWFCQEVHRVRLLGWFSLKRVRQRDARKQQKCLKAVTTWGCKTLSLQRGLGVFWPSALSNRRRPAGGSQHVGKMDRTSILQSCWKPGLCVARKRSFSQVVFQTMSQVSAEPGVFASGRCKTEGQTLVCHVICSACRSALCLIKVGKMHPFTLHRRLSLCSCGDRRKVCRLSLSWNLYLNDESSIWIEQMSFNVNR